MSIQKSIDKVWNVAIRATLKDAIFYFENFGCEHAMKHLRDQLEKTEREIETVNAVETKEGEL